MSGQPQEAPDRRPVVLAADDEAGILQLIDEVLSDAGYRTLTAADGQEALDLAARSRPDLLLLDVSMPVMDGYGQPAAAREVGAQIGPLSRW
jgi:two-component system response regulator AdeR